MLKDMDKIFKALSDKNRLAIFQMIRENCCFPLDADGNLECCCVSDVAKNFELAMSTISHHIKELKNAGLIKCEKKGQRVYCSVSEEVLEKIKSFVSEG